MAQIAGRYGTSPSVTGVVYDMEVVAQEMRRRMKVREAPIGVTFTYTLEDTEATKKISIPQSWLETLAIQLNPSNMQSMTSGLEDYRLGRILSHDEVWVGV